MRGTNGMRRFTFIAALAVSSLSPLAALEAQRPPLDAAAEREPLASPRNVLAASPILAMLGFFTAEYERSITPTASVAVGGSTSAIGPFSYRSADARVRVYPAARPFEGLSVGASAGAIGVASSTVPRGSDGFSTRGIAVGTEASYGWLVGRRRNFALAVGGGFKRIVRLGGHDVSGLQLTLPTVRASFGIAF